MFPFRKNKVGAGLLPALQVEGSRRPLCGCRTAEGDAGSLQGREKATATYSLRGCGITMAEEHKGDSAFHGFQGCNNAKDSTLQS